MDFSLSPELRALRDKTRRFIAEQVIPLESDPRQSHHGPDESLRRELVARARAAGLLTPHASREMGGLGLSHVEKAVVFEEAGYSRLGPTALNIHAPDEGNIHLMEEVATPAQKERWLRPQVAGELRSCFAMTEPSPGAGADPSMLQATAVRDGGDYVINGRKWFITGADGADYAIVMARMEDGSATMFLTDMDRPGIVLESNMDAMDACFTGGHGVLRFENLRVPAADVLGEIGKGFPLRPGTPGARAPHALHALAGPGAPRARHGTGLRAQAPRLRQAAGGARGRGLHGGRQRHGPAHRAPAHLAHRPGCWTRARSATSSRAAPRSCAPRPSGAWWTAACRCSAARA
ncbi:acyl-CoA dehydrogenase [Alicycliphilus sp. B1]|nr:acyl-CoA dehydrogenase [Alicycliphilus sp. B1]